MRQKLYLANQPPVPTKRPINKQSAPDEVCFRHRSPIAAVIAVIAVITQGKIAVLRHREQAIWLREIFMARSVSFVRRFRRHHPSDTVALRCLAIHIGKGGSESQRTSG